MPSSTLDNLADAYTQVSLINKRLLDECEIVGQIFQRQGIKCILLKGADLLSRLYGVRGMRPLSDVDLLYKATLNQQSMNSGKVLFMD